MDKYVNIEDRDNLVRDTHSKAIINTSRSEKKNISSKRNVAKKKQAKEFERDKKMEDMNTKIDRLESSVQDLMQIIKQEILK